jgi:nitrogen fixation protein FixH
MAIHTADTWRHFPRYLILAMGLVVAVNVRFIVLAVATFPGAATNDDFDTSNRYNAVLEAAAAQDALGWSELASARDAVPVIDLTGPDHKPLAGATLSVQAERPLGNADALPVSFLQIAPGHFVAAGPLPERGQWDLRLQVVQGGHKVRVTRRILVK